MSKESEDDQRADALRVMSFQQAHENRRHTENLINTAFQFFVVVVGGILGFIFSKSIPLSTQISNLALSLPLGFIMIYSIITALFMLELKKRRVKEMGMAVINILPLVGATAATATPSENPVHAFRLQFTLIVILGVANIYLVFLNIMSSVWKIGIWSITLPILPTLIYLIFIGVRFHKSNIYAQADIKKGTN